jgi:hypothetical protein
MSIETLARRSKQFISDNAPTILTVAALGGTVASTVLAARAGFKAGYKIAYDDYTRLGVIPEDQQIRLKSGIVDPMKGNDRRKHIAKQTWKLYLPSAITGVGTLTSIATANRVNMNRTAALAAAYTITDKAFSEYKDKVKETIGEKKEDEIHTKIMQDRVNESGEKAGLVMIGSNDVLCYDAYTDRYFQSSMEKLKKAENDTNHEIIHNLYVSLSEFYQRVGLPPTSFSDEVGWDSDNLVELRFSSVMTPDDRPALAFTFHVDPVRGFGRTHG